ncbi:MAG: Lsr2 family DNA-binding protein [Streptosporangiaceae bacterium]
MPGSARTIIKTGDHGNGRRARTWAKAHGLEVKDRGRVPADVLAQYRTATGR